LLSLNLTGRYKGIAQIISWSALDEQQHSDTGIKLFRKLVEEDPLTNEEAKGIMEGFDAVVANEFAFLDKIFEGRTLGTIRKEDVREYILYRANDRLARLGVQKVFKYDEASANRIKDWFHPLMAGATSTDFFAQSKDGGNYIAKPTQDFSGVNLKTLNLVLS